MLEIYLKLKKQDEDKMKRKESFKSGPYESLETP